MVQDFLLWDTNCAEHTSPGPDCRQSICCLGLSHRVHLKESTGARSPDCVTPPRRRAMYADPQKVGRSMRVGESQLAWALTAAAGLHAVVKANLVRFGGS